MTEAKASSDEANAGDGPAFATPLSSSVATEKPPSTDRGDGLGKKDSSDEAAPAPASSDGQSFSQLLGTVSSPAASHRPAAIVTVPVVAVPYFISPASLVEPQGIAVQFAMTHQAALATVTAQAQMQLQAACTSSSNSMTTMLSTVSPTPLQQMPPPTPKKTFGDLYNWRKYGQKQVKSSENARSYYRCTHTNCSAKKKVEHCPDGTVVEVIYAGKHNHDPPQKHRYIRDRGTQPGSSLLENESLERVNTESDKSDPSVSKTDQNSNNGIPKQPLYCSSDCEFDAATKSEEDMDDEPKTKRRPSENSKSSSVPVLKTVKEYIVQTEIDARHLSDGYRWRKYGQKFVKGNSNPRSYYRCTYGGCPVRKHVERASHDAKALLITYEGEHNHDQPNSNFSGDSSLAALKTNVTAGMTDEKLSRSTESLKKASCKSHSNSAVEEGEGDGEHEHEGDQVLESAQALLSMGFSSTSGETVPRSSSEGLKSPILNETPGAVSVQNT